MSDKSSSEEDSQDHELISMKELAKWTVKVLHAPRKLKISGKKEVSTGK